MPFPIIVPVGLAALVAFIAAASGSEAKQAQSPGDAAERDAFDALVAAAIAKGDTVALEALAKQAEAHGWTDEAKSIRDEIARLTATAPKKTTPIPVTDAPSTATPAGRSTIKLGSKGPDVVEWQRLLGVTQDGIFGPITDKQTKAWQAAHGLTADGIVGPKTWAAAYAVDPSLANKPKPVVPAPGTVTPAPKAAPAPALATGHATIRLGSKGPAVSEWQAAIGAAVDGIFGPNTDAATRAWQKAHGLTADGIVGPATWASLNTAAPKPAAPAMPKPATPAAPKPAASHQTIMYGSRNNDVKVWQTNLGVTADGMFGQATDTATRAWQKAHGLPADGIVGPATWATLGQPADSVIITNVDTITPNTPAIVDHSSDTAAKELTGYLTSIGGLAGRGKENKSDIAAWSKELGVYDAKGLYGRDMAKQVMLRGLVPVVPYYWPSTGAAKAKADFTTLVRTYSNADPQRAAAWTKLLSDIVKA